MFALSNYIINWWREFEYIHHGERVNRRSPAFSPLQLNKSLSFLMWVSRCILRYVIEVTIHLMLCLRAVFTHSHLKYTSRTFSFAQWQCGVLFYVARETKEIQDQLARRERKVNRSVNWSRHENKVRPVCVASWCRWCQLQAIAMRFPRI